MPWLLPLAFVVIASSFVRGEEFRGLWVDAFHAGIKSSAEVTQLVADTRAANMNAVFVQVRKRGDAYYNSTLEPKATDVTPQAFDPLADLIAKAHAGTPRIEVHAWIVTYNVWNGETSQPAQATHPYRLHPEWVTEKDDGTKWDGGNYAFDQAHPAVQQHTFDVCQDILTRYEVDGLHFDYIRYTDSNSSVGSQPWGYHPVALQRFKALTGRTDRPPAGDAEWLQFRRDQVSALVRKVYLHAWKIRPAARISGALICYGAAPASGTLAAWQGRDAYGRVLQDWRGWLEEGILDLAIPMIYRDYSDAARRAEYNAWCAWTRDNQFNRAGAAGPGIYLNAVADTISEVKQARVTGGGKSLGGSVLYSYGVPTKTAGITRAEVIAALTDDAAAETYDPGGTPVFAEAVAAPSMPWKTDVSKGHLMGFLTDSEGVKFDGASVTITGVVTRTVKTDATGFFGAVDLPAGEYTLTVSVPGYLPVTRTVTVTGALVAETSVVLNAQGVPDFAITGHQWNGPQRKLTLTWNSRPGKTYRVELSGNLSTWTPLSTGLPSGGASTMWTSATLPVATRHFFRVKEE
ncbi:MAG TPA: family 10 glycosylhydrolase [Verrucomicrobiales bacterium]|nr:family 10 glycosylhydrolase [Verrucomicrobiales bacterium]